MRFAREEFFQSFTHFGLSGAYATLCMIMSTDSFLLLRISHSTVNVSNQSDIIHSAIQKSGGGGGL